MRSCLLQGDILQSLLLETLVDGQLMFITREQKTAGVLLVSPSMRMLQKHTLWRSKNIASERNSKASREMITTKEIKETHEETVSMAEYTVKGKYRIECFGETISYAESLGFVDDVDDADWDAGMADGLESEAIAFIESKGIEVIEEE